MRKVDDVRRAGLKKCNRCVVFKPMDNFYRRLDKENRCKGCVSELRKIAYKKNPEKIINWVRRYRKGNPEKIRDTKLKQTYGVSVENWNKMFSEQNGVCAICKKPEKTIWRGRVVNLSVDHDHETLEVRGLLCIKCNRAFGLLEESIETMLAMIEYAEKFQKLR